jgi:hypothetical protein
LTPAGDHECDVAVEGLGNDASNWDPASTDRRRPGRPGVRAVGSSAAQARDDRPMSTTPTQSPDRRRPSVGALRLLADTARRQTDEAAELARAKGLEPGPPGANRRARTDSAGDLPDADASPPAQDGGSATDRRPDAATTAAQKPDRRRATEGEPRLIADEARRHATEAAERARANGHEPRADPLNRPRRAIPARDVPSAPGPAPGKPDRRRHPPVGAPSRSAQRAIPRPAQVIGLPRNPDGTGRDVSRQDGTGRPAGGTPPRPSGVAPPRDPPIALSIVSEAFCQVCRVLPIELRDGALDVYMSDPADTITQELLRLVVTEPRGWRLRVSGISDLVLTRSIRTVFGSDVALPPDRRRPGAPPPRPPDPAPG